MALTTQLLVKIAGNADGLISALAKTGRTGRDAFKEVSTSAKTEFEKARKEAERAFKDVDRLQKESAAHARAGRTDLAGAFEGQAIRRAAEADQAAAAVISAEKRIAAESIKTGAITKTALIGGASGAGAAFTREGSAISRVFGTVRAEAIKTGAAIKTGLSSGAFEGIGKSATVAGAGVLAGFAVAAKATIGFDKALSNVAAVSGATGKELGLLRQAALDAGSATSFTATEAAQAESELAKAGLSVHDVMSALPGVLDLAASGQVDVATAASLAASSMTVFGLSGDQVSHVADVLAAGANKSLASVESLGLGLAQTALVAKQFGFSFEDTVATLALFDDNMLKGADGGTALKTMLLALGAPTAAARQEMQKLGIAVYDINGAIKPASQIMEEMRRTMGPLSDETRNAALQTIFGRDAFRAAAIAVKSGAGGFQEYRDGVNDAGAASKFAGVQMDNLAGDLERLKGSIETGLIGAGSGATGVLRTLATGAEDAVNAFGSLPSGVQGTVGVLTGLSGAALVAGGSIAFLAPKVAAARAQLVALGPAGVAASKGLGLLGRAAGVGAVLFTIGEGLNLLGNQIDTLAHGKTNLSAMSEGLADFARTGKATGEVAKQFGSDLGELPGKLKKLDLKGIDFLASGSFRDAKKDVDALDKALAGLVKTGSGGQSLAGDLLGDIAKKAGVPVADLKKKLNDYTDAVHEANAQTKVAALTQGDQAGAAGRAGAATKGLAADQDALKQAAAAASDALKEEITQLTGLTDLNLAVSGSNISFIQSLTGIKTALAENGKSFDVNTEAGQKNQEALNAGISAAQAHAAAVGEQTGSVEYANATLQQHRTQLIETATSAGLSKDAASRYVDALLKIPPSKATIVSIETAQAEANLRRIIGLAETLPRALAPLSGRTFLRLPGMAMGGPVQKDRRYEVAEKGTELFVPEMQTRGQISDAGHLASHADKQAREGLVRLGIPGGVASKASREGTPALLLGKHGPQLFTPPTDGVVVKSSDTARLMRTHDEDIITRILKRAGLDRRSMDALAVAPARAAGGRVEQGQSYKVGEQGTEAWVPKFNFARGGVAPQVTPGIKRGSDGSYHISIGDTHLTVEANTVGGTKGVSKSDVDAIVRKHQAAMANELSRSLEQGKR